MSVKAKERGPIAVLCLVVALAGSAAAQPTVVVGTGDPNVDVPAVQAAVDRGGNLLLSGHFSFDRPPSARAGSIYNRMVTVSKSIAISGMRDGNGDLPVIQGGDWPFLIDAGDAHVTIQGLHFVGPSSGAIWIYSVAGLTIAGCRIENVQPTVEFGTEGGQANPVSVAIFAGANAHPPNAANPGTPENFSGTLAILNNDIDVGAMPGTQTLGIAMFAVGRSPDMEVNILVSGNNIRNVNEPAINFRVVGGRAYAERNLVITGATAGTDAIRVVGSGSYVIAHNTIDCGWVSGAVVGIDVIGQPPPMAPASGVIIVDNLVNMSSPPGAVFNANNAAIEMKGFTQGNSVLNNRILGRANAAFAMVAQNQGMPISSSFIANDLTDFQPALADIFIDAGVTDTFVLGRQVSMQDNGSGTVLVSRFQ